MTYTVSAALCELYGTKETLSMQLVKAFLMTELAKRLPGVPNKLDLEE